MLTMTNPKIETDLSQILSEIKEEIKANREQLVKITVDQAEIKTKVINIESQLTEVKGSQSKQVWALIGIVFTAVGILGKIVFFPTH